MSKSDDYFRRHRQRPRQEEPEEAPKSAPLVSQGPRSGGVPRREVSVDDVIRAAAGRLGSPGGWTRIS